MNCQEQKKRDERAERLRKARALAGFRGPKGVATALNMSVNNCKAQEQGRMGIGVTDARRYARLFGVSFEWLYFGAETLGEFELSSKPRMVTGWKERLNAAVSESGRSMSDNFQMRFSIVTRSRASST